jgi:hypothetical protein
VSPPLTESVCPDIGGIIRCEEPHGRRDVQRPCDATQGDSPLQGLVSFWLASATCRSSSVRRSGTNHVDGDATTCELSSERIAKRGDATLRAGVHHLAGGSDTPGVGCHVHDATCPTFTHLGSYRVAHGDGAPQVDRKQAVPRAGLAIEKRLDPADAGVVDRMSIGPSCSRTALTIVRTDARLDASSICPSAWRSSVERSAATCFAPLLFTSRWPLARQTGGDGRADTLCCTIHYRDFARDPPYASEIADVDKGEYCMPGSRGEASMATRETTPKSCRIVI